MAQWLSLGENCLPDDVLKRHGLKSSSSPFSSTRSNVDYVIEANRTDFAGFLDKRNLVRDDAFGSPVIRSTLYPCDTGLFERSVSLGFEFTHHDVIENLKHRESFERKIARWRTLRASAEPVVFLYHHRRTSTNRLAPVVSKLQQFADDFDRDAAGRSRIILFYQEIVSDPAQRDVDLRVESKNVSAARLRTEFVWGGKDPHIFWARNDDDLFASLIRQMQEA